MEFSKSGYISGRLTVLMGELTVGVKAMDEVSTKFPAIIRVIDPMKPAIIGKEPT